MSVQTVFQSAITGHPQCIKLSFYFWAARMRRPISVPVQARFMGDLLLLQFKSIVNMIYGDVSYLQTGSSIFPPDELVPSAHVTVVCFPHRPIFIPRWQIKSAMFLRKLFFPSLLLFPCMTCSTITGDGRLTPRNELHRTLFSPSSSSNADMSNIQTFNRGIAS